MDLKKMLVPFLYYKYLLSQLTVREIKARYKQSFVGYLWVLLNPLSQLLVYTFVFSVVFRFPTNDIPYSIFLFAGLLPWTFFQTAILSATNSLVSNATLLKKVAFPREVIPYSSIISKIVDFLFSSIIFFIFLIIFNVPLAPTAIWFIPLFLVQILLVTGISLFLSAANLFYRDIQYLANLVLMLWLYLTPIVYPLSMVPMKYLWLYKLNPMVGLVEGYRSALFGYPFELIIIAWSVGVSILIFFASFIFFKHTEKVFADVV